MKRSRFNKQTRRMPLAFAALLSLAIVVIIGCTASHGPYEAQQPRPFQMSTGDFPPLHLREDDQRLVTANNFVPPESMPAPGEELWIIEKHAPVAAAADDTVPGCGSLLARTAPETPINKLLPCPLKHTNVKASVAGYIASVEVTQQFHNPFGVKIEAVYVFPLPSNAAVNEFVMTIGDRHIRGIVREREQARKIYENARSQGFVASLMTQERPNIFTQSVANIEPGKEIDISICYFNTLTYSDGWYELAFPMVVGPRFNPPGTTDGIGAVGPGARGGTAQKTEVSTLRPGTRNGHDISLLVDLDAGVPYEEVRSINHAVSVTRQDEQRAIVRLNSADSVPNKDFLLRWRVAGDRVKSGVVAVKDEAHGGHFAMMIIPPADLRTLPRKPLEFVFTLDVSGSMSGRPIEQAKSAMLYALRRMTPMDRFQVVKFADRAEQMSRDPVPATPENINLAMRYVREMDAGGGTMMLAGMQRSLDFPRDPDRMRIVAFLTDGYIGDEAQILRAMRDWIGEARVFSFGVGSSPNRFLLEHMAKIGRGAAGYVSLNENPDDVMAAFFERTSHPALTDLSVEFGHMDVKEIFPRKLPDLFVGRPIILTGKFAGIIDGPVRITGRVNGETRWLDVPVRKAEPLVARALPAVWARSKIADLGDEATVRSAVDLAGKIRQVALEYGLMSSFTSFIAVDSTRRTQGSFGVSTPVAVPVPDGVRYDTTVSEGVGR